jgi:hypothetical protein
MDAFIRRQVLRRAHPTKNIVVHGWIDAQKHVKLQVIAASTEIALFQYIGFQLLVNGCVIEAVRRSRVGYMAFGTRSILEISNSEMPGLEGPESYQPGYTTSARSYIGVARLVTSLDPLQIAVTASFALLVTSYLVPHLVSLPIFLGSIYLQLTAKSLPAT